jgi:hypothetical protein
MFHGEYLEVHGAVVAAEKALLAAASAALRIP